MNRKDGLTISELEKRQIDARNEIRNLASEGREIGDRLSNTWGSDRLKLLKRQEEIKQLLDRQPDIVAGHTHDLTLVHLKSMASRVKQLRAEIEGIDRAFDAASQVQRTKFEKAFSQVKEQIEREYSEHWAQQEKDFKARYGDKVSFKPMEIEKDFMRRKIEDAEKRLKTKYITAVREDTSDQEAEIRRITGQAQDQYGLYVNLLDETSLERAANEQAQKAYAEARRLRISA